MFTETYPGGVTSTYAYDATGTPVSVSYSGPDWTAPLTDTIVPNAAGDWATQAITDTATSLVSNQTYSYDNAARITNVQDSLNGQCTARAYTYDADSNRTGLTTDAPSSNGTCQTSTGTTATTTYDSADRDTNTGYTYDTHRAADKVVSPVHRSVVRRRRARSRSLSYSALRMVAAMSSWPAWRMRPMMRLRRVARARGRDPARTLDASSRKVTSRTRWTLFSMLQ